jgi:hypothetical protein
LSIQTRKCFIKSYIWSIFLYGCETWTLKKDEKDELEAMEMWIWRRTTTTSWTERKRNDTILQEIGEERNIITAIMKRKVKLIGHLLKHNDSVTNILEGKIMGKPRGRPRQLFFNDIKQRMGFTSYQHLKYTTRNREDWLLRQGLAFRN